MDYSTIISIVTIMTAQSAAILTVLRMWWKSDMRHQKEQLEQWKNEVKERESKLEKDFAEKLQLLKEWWGQEKDYLKRTQDKQEEILRKISDVVQSLEVVTSGLQNNGVALKDQIKELKKKIGG